MESPPHRPNDLISVPPEAVPDVPLTRSRVGDFVFAAVVGIMMVVSGMMIGGLHPAAAGVITTLYLMALLLRYVTLEGAVPVPAGTNVTLEQVRTLERLRALLDALPQPVMLLDPDGTIDSHNPAANAVFGPSLVGRHVSSTVRTPIALEAMRLAKANKEPEEVEVTVAGSPQRTFLVHAAPLALAAPEPEGRLVVMFRDRTEQKRLEKTRTDFIANASHELRTPLTSMTGFIETLQGHAKDDPVARERFLEIMAGQTERMLRLVEDLIGLSAIEINAVNPPSEQVDLVAIARSVSEAMAPLVQAQNASMDCDFEMETMPLIGDRLELFRLLQNLCDNALKYGVTSSGEPASIVIRGGCGMPPSREGALQTGDAPIQIAIRNDVEVGDLRWIRVEDNGEGIDPNDLPRLTERFYRVNPELSKAKGGTGLGLAIVKHILQRHRAGLQIESQLGQGSAFTCIFPTDTDAFPAEGLDERT